MLVDAIFKTIGALAVRFRWLVAIAWIVGTLAAVNLLPSLSSVTQSNNTKFLPSSAPSERAAQLAAAFGTSNEEGEPVVIARSGAPLTPTDLAAITTLQHKFTQVATVKKVVDLGRSRDGQAEQLLVLVPVGGGNQNAVVTLVDNLRAAIHQTTLPPGLQAHLAGPLAVAVDQQNASGNTGNKVQNYSSLFIIVLLVLIFRSLTLAVTTLIPAIASVLISGPLVAEAAHHGLQVSPLAQYLMIVLVLGAGTDYGLFLVFRVREELRNASHGEESYNPADHGGLLRSVARDLFRSRAPAKEAIVTSVTRVGESITFSGATVIAAVLTLLLASFPFYSDLGIPFAIAIGVVLLAALTLLPALLSIRLSLLAVKRTVFTAVFKTPKLIPLSIQPTKDAGFWGTVAGRIVRRPVPVLLAGIIVFGGLAFAVLGYQGSGFGGNATPPAGSDSAAGTALLARHFPQSSANPTTLIFRFGTPVWEHPGTLNAVSAKLVASGEFTGVTGPLNPGGIPMPPATYSALHTKLGPASALPPMPPPGSGVPPLLYEAYRATSNSVSPDGRTVLFEAGLQAGDPGSTPALNAVPRLRSVATSVAHAVGATDSGVGGEAPALADINSISNSDLVHIIPVAIVAIGILLALVLRSLVAPLYLIASVGISYLAALGLSVLVFTKAGLGTGAGLVFFLPFLMFIFLLALGEDYNILVMTRIREEAHKRPLREAVSTALGVTGTTVTSAGLVLAGTFVVFGIVAGGGSGGSQFRHIAFGLAFGILMDTFLVRTLLVPSTVVLLGRWNWWPSRLQGPADNGKPSPPPVPGEETPRSVPATG
ncbi:MAG TPA: MMPL family transporter [Streptosporangiaceae bacterium]|nr:MMPL family transporter [Streptosporangiaceae bacterium]